MAEEVYSLEDQKKRAASTATTDQDTQAQKASTSKISSHTFHGGDSDSSSSFEDKSRLLRVVRRRSIPKKPEVRNSL